MNSLYVFHETVGRRKVTLPTFGTGSFLWFLSWRQTATSIVHFVRKGHAGIEYEGTETAVGRV